MSIEEIDVPVNRDYVYVYFHDVSVPLAISKDAFYKWLEDNEMLHWAEDPTHPDQVGEAESGEYSFDEYFNLPLSVIQTDINKYIQTLDL